MFKHEKVNFFEGLAKNRARKEEDNTRNARETRDNDGELMLVNTLLQTLTRP